MRFKTLFLLAALSVHTANLLAASLTLEPYEKVGAREAAISDATASGASLEYLANPSGRNDTGLVGAIGAASRPTFETVGDRLTYRFTLTVTKATNNNFTPLYRVGFDFGSTAALRYETSTGTQSNLRFGSNTDGNPFTSGNVSNNQLDWESWSPFELIDIRFDDGNQIDAIVSLELIGISGGFQDYALTVSYTSATNSTDTNSKRHEFTGVNGDQVVSVFHATDSSGMVEGDAYTVSDATLVFESPSALALTSALVEDLPETTTAEKIKKAVLQIGMERAVNAVAVSLVAEGETIRAAVEQAIGQDPAEFIEVNSNAPAHLPVLRELVTPYANNPYLQRLEQDAFNDLSGDDVPWPRATSVNQVINSLDGDYGARTAFSLMAEYVWLFAHEESPMRHDPELLKRILRRAHAYVDSVELGPDVTGTPVPNWFDQFSVPVAFTALYELRSLYPGVLLPLQAARWDQVMQDLAGRMESWYFLQNGYSPWNINIETGRLVGVVVSSLWTAFDRDNSWLMERAYNRIDATTARLFADGAVPYHGTGQASTNYHNELLLQWQLLYELTGYAPLLQAMLDTQWKGPVMGRTEEFWTSPFYKAFRWNYSKGTEAGSELVATVSRNPYTRWLLDRDMFPDDYFTPGNVLPLRYQVPWYDATVIANPLPDRYIIADRNTGGPRTWYGNFNHAGAFRPNPNQTRYEGHETLMGAMTVDDDGRVNSILVGVTPRIWQTPESVGDLSAWADLTINEATATTLSRSYSVSSAIHDITRRRNESARTDAVSGWTARQVWIGLPDRLLGLVSTVPSSGEAQAYAVNGVLRFISGGTAGAEVSKALEQIIPDSLYRYGQLDVLVHDNSYASISPVEVPYRLPAYPAAELTFSNRQSEPLALGNQDTFPAETEYRFLVEVRPIWTTKNLTGVTLLGDRDLIGLNMVDEDMCLQVWLNASGSTRTVSLQRNLLPDGRDSLVLSDGVLGASLFEDTVPASVTLQPGQHAVLVVSADSEAHAAGWESFEEMVNTPLLGMASVPEGLQIDYRGTLQESTDLNSWTDMNPQPGSPWIFVPEAGDRRFFQIKPAP